MALKIAQIGAGRMGTIHARNAAADARLNLSYLVETRSEAASNLAAEIGGAVATLEEALADPEVVGVVVASSTDAHLDHTLASLRAGKVVFCEKPLDLDLQRLRSHAAELTDASGRLLVGFNRRFDPHFIALKAKIDAGAIGAIESLHLISHDPAPPPPSFIPTSGGLFKDFTIHDFDMARWLLPDEPTEVFAWASCLVDPSIGEAGDVDTARVLLRTASGCLCVVSNTRRSGYGYDQRIEAYGSVGMASAGNPATSNVELWREGGALGAPIHAAFPARYAQAYRNEMSHFADILTEEATSLVSYEASAGALALAEAAALSHRTGSAVRVEDV